MAVSAVGGLLGVLCLAGCEDAARKPVQARVPALAPVQLQKPETAVVQELPLRRMAPDDFPSLLPPVPGGIPYLIEQVKAKFASGRSKLQGRAPGGRAPGLRRFRRLDPRERVRPEQRPEAARVVPAGYRQGLYLRTAGVPRR